MTDDATDRLPLGATLGAVANALWALKMPYVALILLVSLPWALMTEFGLFDPLVALEAIDPEADPEAYLAAVPVGLFLVVGILALVTLWTFAIIWLRYLMLGGHDALRVTPGAFAVMLGRFAVNGLIVGGVAFLLMILGTLLVCGLLVPLCASLGLPSLVANMVAGSIGIFLVAGLPLAFLARMSLVFPAIAMGEKLTLAESWAAVRGSTWNLISCLFVVSLVTGLLAYGAQYLAYGLFGIDFTNPAQSAAVQSHWLVGFLLGPITGLSSAAFWAVIAVAHRDLSPDDQASDLAQPAGAVG